MPANVQLIPCKWTIYINCLEKHKHSFQFIEQWKIIKLYRKCGLWHLVPLWPKLIFIQCNLCLHELQYVHLFNKANLWWGFAMGPEWNLRYFLFYHINYIWYLVYIKYKKIMSTPLDIDSTRPYFIFKFHNRGCLILCHYKAGLWLNCSSQSR